MDPSENIKEQRLLIGRLLDNENDDKEEGSIDSGDAVRLAELARALDEWISSGGLLPWSWRKVRGAQANETTVYECCDNQDRNFNGGCDNCGDPCL